MRPLPVVYPRVPTGAQRRLVEAIQAQGFDVLFRRFIEDQETPGFLGQIAGRTDRAGRLVLIATNRASAREITRRLRHELRHVLEPDWDCGSRPPLKIV